ncbi:hypothetical protein SAMN05216505_10281 [Streptomyces prasinopilosus]|uniref:Rhomboid family protein n=1 Tax=Streptomyces prasinopilosus TaxID=67344 RepID=A0A1G6LEC5_9ACTN|nr:hypothetical protein SAMN05216505_10281 [Streptomyces prasinopilosus]
MPGYASQEYGTPLLEDTEDGLSSGTDPGLRPSPLRLPAWIVPGLWFVLQAVHSSGAGVTGAGTVAHLAHVAGFVAGTLIARPLEPGTPPPPEPGGVLFGRQTRRSWQDHTPGAGQRGGPSYRPAGGRGGLRAGTGAPCLMACPASIPYAMSRRRFHTC